MLTRNVSETYMPPWCKNSGLSSLRSKTCPKQVSKGVKYIIYDHLLIEGNPCTKFGIDQVKGSKDIGQTTQWAEKSGLTLTFDHVT